MDVPSGEVRGFQRLYEFSRQVLAEEHSEGLVDRLVEAVRQAIDANCVILFRFQNDAEEIWARSTDEDDGFLDPSPNYSRTLVQEVIKQGRPLLIEDLSDHVELSKARSIQFLCLTSAMGAPLYIDGILAGVLYATRRRLANNFGREDRELLTVAAAQAGLLMRHVEAQARVRASEKRLQALIDVSPTAILVVGVSGVLFSNRSARELWDFPSDEALREQGVTDLFEGWRSTGLLQAMKTKESFDAIEAWVRSGSLSAPSRMVEVWGEPVYFDGEEAIQLAINPVGGKRIGIARQARAERLAAMGAMAATVGHEINNPLAFVLANLDYSLEVVEDAMAAGEDTISLSRLETLVNGLNAAIEGSERIRALVSSIQGFSRLDESTDGCSDVTTPLESSLRLASTELRGAVEVQVDLRPTNPVGLDSSRLGQVFLNLLVNAGHALNDLPPEAPRRLEVRCRQIEDEVVIEIADNGPGVDPKIQEELFRPFATTKRSQDGTGLGLAIVSEIVESAQGRVEVESAPGKGALFRVILPAREELSTSSFEVLEELEDYPAGAVLVVDPEPILGRSIELLLEPHHEVSVVHTLGDAVEMLSGAKNFDVILCDLRLRGGVGLSVFRWVEKNAPRQWEKMLAMTADFSSQAEQDYLSKLPNGWITKPFHKACLRAKVGRLVEASSQSLDASGSKR